MKLVLLRQKITFHDENPFEDYSYQTEDIKSVLGDFILSKLDLTKQTQLLRYVGYFFNSEIENEDGTKGDLVFILPKVLIDVDKDGKETVFGLNPSDIIHFNYEDWKKDESIVATGTLTKKKVYDFIYGFAIWIYRAVDIYRKNQNRKPKDEQDDPEAEVMTSVQVGQSGKRGCYLSGCAAFTVGFSTYASEFHHLRDENSALRLSQNQLDQNHLQNATAAPRRHPHLYESHQQEKGGEF